MNSDFQRLEEPFKTFHLVESAILTEEGDDSSKFDSRGAVWVEQQQNSTSSSAALATMAIRVRELTRAPLGAITAWRLNSTLATTALQSIETRHPRSRF
jgi:hypothetical protein